MIKLLKQDTKIQNQVINFQQKLSLFSEQWKPKVIAEMNDYQFKLGKLEGDIVWHDHPYTDETFIVIEGTLRIDFRDGTVSLKAGEMFVVPKGAEHMPFAETSNASWSVRKLPIHTTTCKPAAIPSTSTLFCMYFSSAPSSANRRRLLPLRGCVSG